jgi:histidine triad (HIT) family protein
MIRRLALYMNCIFCKIIAGEIPSAKVYEDEKVLAFLDIEPVSKGHTLVIPKEHHKMMTDAPDELIEYIFVKAKMLMNKIKKATNAYLVSLSVVGDEVPHFHVHLIPRHKDDGLSNWNRKKYEEGQMEEEAKSLRAVISDTVI